MIKCAGMLIVSMLTIIIPNVTMLTVILLSVIMLCKCNYADCQTVILFSVVMPGAIMLSKVIMNILVPCIQIITAINELVNLNTKRS